MAVFKFFHPLVWIILGGTIFTRIASFMAMPFLAIYLHNEIGASPLEIGITIGIAPLLSTVSGFFGGYFTDRFGRKIVILSTILVWSIVFFGFATAQSIWLFVLFNALNGLCRSFFEPSTQALMIDFTPADKRKRLFSLRYTAINIAAVIGPIIGVYIAKLANPSMPFILTGIMYIIYTIFLFFVLNHYTAQASQPSTKTSIRQTFTILLTNRVLLSFILGAILINIGYSQFDSTLPQFIELKIEDGVALYSLLISLNAGVVLLLQLPISIVTERFSTTTTLLVGVLFFALGLLLFGFSTNYPLYITAMVIFTIGEIFAFPTMNVMIDEIAPDTQKGTYLGAAQFRNLGGFIGPIIGGWLLTHYLDGMFIIIAILVLCSALFYRMKPQQS
ncbi:MDR family MFS transporter [Lysinibacillus piscis]|uniref:MFS-type transporter YqjV n=1 Tax=Lysinibacillus piscis TaxID=2518931 RepID=A0ABQ5NIR3_9BACI|nr:MFS transporter [Lysinibacillus sp. KH24]GLC88184.1 putative MFS-type transporter YqjV [Lysinibacillus sp. KH24]